MSLKIAIISHTIIKSKLKTIQTIFNVVLQLGADVSRPSHFISEETESQRKSATILSEIMSKRFKQPILYRYCHLGPGDVASWPGVQEALDPIPGNEKTCTHAHTHTHTFMHTSTTYTYTYTCIHTNTHTYTYTTTLVIVSIAVKRHPDHCNSYKGKYLIGAAHLHFRGSVHYHHGDMAVCRQTRCWRSS